MLYVYSFFFILSALTVVRSMFMSVVNIISDDDDGLHRPAVPPPYSDCG